MTPSNCPFTAIYLTNHKMPSTSITYLSDEEVRVWFGGWLELWRPEILVRLEGLPLTGGPYDHDPARGNHIYSVSPQTLALLPQDWVQKARDAGSEVIEICGSDSSRTEGDSNPSLSIEPFVLATGGALKLQALGLGKAWLDAFCESQDHPNLLDSSQFWQLVSETARFILDGDDALATTKAQDAAALLVTAREGITTHGLFHLDLILGPALSESDLESGTWLAGEYPRNLIASGSWLAEFEQKHPKSFSRLRELVDLGQIEVLGGVQIERDDPLTSVESQEWNLKKAKATYEALLGREPKVFARASAGLNPNYPLLLQQAGYRRAVLVSFDEATVPHYRSPVVSWAGSDGKSIEALARVPLPAESMQTWFHMAYHLGRAVREDHAPTVVLCHRNAPGALATLVGTLARLGPVMGRWLLLSDYFNEATPAEYPGVAPADDFAFDWLAPDNQDKPPEVDPVSRRANRARARRKVDAAFALGAIHEVLDKGVGEWSKSRRLLACAEDAFEEQEKDPAAVLESTAQMLAARLLRGAPEAPGILVFNGCAFTRRIAFESRAITGHLEIQGVVKAFSKEGDLSRCVVEVPALGYCWIPRKGGEAKPVPRARMRLADEKAVRNEFFEAEIDPQTGAIKAFRDVKSRQNRGAIQLVFLPGSRMKADEVTVGSTGPALGELTVKGVLVDEKGDTIARFTQRLRAWIGRPVLEVQVELEPLQLPTGYPWHSLYAARFSLPLAISSLKRGSGGFVDETRHNRPLSPEFVEWTVGSGNCVLLTGGMPLLQRHGSSQFDLVLLPPGETANRFEFGLALDRNHPQQLALGWVSPAPLVEVEQGPPASGSSAWLFHQDLPNVLVGNFRTSNPAEGDTVQLDVRIQECEGHYSVGELRCFRAPTRASSMDSDGISSMGLGINEDAVQLEVPRREMSWLNIHW